MGCGGKDGIPGSLREGGTRGGQRLETGVSFIPTTGSSAAFASRLTGSGKDFELLLCTNGKSECKVLRVWRNPFSRDLPERSVQLILCDDLRTVSPR